MAVLSVIKIIFGANASSTPFKLGFADGGDTVMVGPLTLGAIDGAESVDGFRITASAESLEIDRDDPTAAGGAIGSIYTFTYYGANAVFCEARGMCTTGTPAITAAVASSTGT